MENKIYNVYAFTADGLGRYGLILVAANSQKEAFDYLMITKYAKVYQIAFEKEATDIKHIANTEYEDSGKIVFKSWIEI